LGKPEIANDGRFATNPDRVAFRDTLVPILQTAFHQQTTDYWFDQCTKNKIPCGPIQTLDQVANDPQLHARNMFLKADHPTAGEVNMIGSPLKLSRTPVEVRHHPPSAGEHDDEIKANLT